MSLTAYGAIHDVVRGGHKVHTLAVTQHEISRRGVACREGKILF